PPPSKAGVASLRRPNAGRLRRRILDFASGRGHPCDPGREPSLLQLPEITSRRRLGPGFRVSIVVGTLFVLGSPLAISAFAAPPSVRVARQDRARLAAEKMRVGDARLRLDDLRGACKAYRETIKLLPTWWMPRLALVRCGRFIGVPSRELIEHARFAVKARPQIPITHLQLGLVLEESGQLKEAIVAYRAALRTHTDLFEARYRLGVLLAELGEHRSARRHLEQVLEARPGYVVARFHLGPLLETLGDLPAAETSYRELVNVSRNRALALSRLARFYQRHKMDREAAQTRREYNSLVGAVN
ncbi:MAG: tetratricopeptide (TPR) repeat protein, partial [Myxococcota bacterium]